ncbi:MAG TPA: hypothetical protein DD740_01815 [Chryseobacterium sp.]|nr:hypothetical protein [Chryseobacterium sp.]
MISAAQLPPPVLSSHKSTGNQLKISSRKSAFIQKETFTLGKFKTLNFQKIVSKDLTDNTSESVFAIMILTETYDQIWIKTLTIDKPELSKLISALQVVQQKEQEKTVEETKYKFVTNSGIEFGSVYNNESKLWHNYITFPSGSFNQSFIEFSKDELKDLIKLLKDAEQIVTDNSVIFEKHRIKVSLYTSFKNLSLHFNNWYEKTFPLINGSCFPKYFAERPIGLS